MSNPEFQAHLRHQLSKNPSLSFAAVLAKAWRSKDSFGDLSQDFLALLKEIMAKDAVREEDQARVLRFPHAQNPCSQGALQTPGLSVALGLCEAQGKLLVSDQTGCLEWHLPDYTPNQLFAAHRPPNHQAARALRGNILLADKTTLAWDTRTQEWKDGLLKSVVPTLRAALVFRETTLDSARVASQAFLEDAKFGLAFRDFNLEVRSPRLVFAELIREPAVCSLVRHYPRVVIAEFEGCMVWIDPSDCTGYKVLVGPCPEAKSINQEALDALKRRVVHVMKRDISVPMVDVSLWYACPPIWNPSTRVFTPVGAINTHTQIVGRGDPEREFVEGFGKLGGPPPDQELPRGADAARCARKWDTRKLIDFQWFMTRRINKTNPVVASISLPGPSIDFKLRDALVLTMANAMLVRDMSLATARKLLVALPEFSWLLTALDGELVRVVKPEALESATVTTTFSAIGFDPLVFRQTGQVEVPKEALATSVLLEMDTRRRILFVNMHASEAEVVSVKCPKDVFVGGTSKTRTNLKLVRKSKPSDGFRVFYFL